MLVIRRRTNQSILLFINNEEITVHVTDIKDGVVKLGIQATDKIKVLRNEVLEKYPKSQLKVCQKST
jgi:carbon storage regulator CsrA